MSKRRYNLEGPSEGRQLQSKQPNRGLSTDEEWSSSQSSESTETQLSETDSDWPDSEQDNSFSDRSMPTGDDNQSSEFRPNNSGRTTQNFEARNVHNVESTLGHSDSDNSDDQPRRSHQSQVLAANSEERCNDNNGLVETYMERRRYSLNANDENFGDERGSDGGFSSTEVITDAGSEVPSDDDGSDRAVEIVSDSDSEDSQNNDAGQDNVDLYDGAPLTVSESLMSILNFALRHKTSKALLSDTLQLIRLHCPPENHCPKTLYSFDKFFAETQTPLKRHYYCAICVRPLARTDSICETCNAKSAKYFIEVPIIEQLQALYKRPGFREKLRYKYTRVHENDGNYEDVFDGELYKSLSADGNFLANPDNISLTWYADGFRIFKSSDLSIWAVYLRINELPFADRTAKENVILAGLWFANNKPIPHLLLKPICASLQELRRGIDVIVPGSQIPMRTRGIVICGTCDLPAKALFLNMIQYNGYFGCQKCMQNGEYLAEHSVFIYPFEPFILRTTEETRTYAEQAFATRKPVYGVKGPTILSSMVHDNIGAIAVDVMHCVFEGVVKSLMKFWFLPKFSEHPASLMNYLDVVDERIAALTPPSSVQKLPRSIKKHLAYWKAHEFKGWLFYQSIPCINDIMPQTYFNHYKLLVLGVSVLCRSSISLNDLEIASRALTEFVSMFEHLYNRKNMTNNVHQLLHLTETVRQFGPLWTTSCFPFEDLNGQLVKLVHGSNGAQLQIPHAISMYLNLTTLKSEKLIEGRPATAFCESLDYKRGRMKRYLISDSMYIVGKCTKLNPVPIELSETFQRQEVVDSSFFYYRRLLKKKSLYSSIEYKRSTKTNSSYVAYSTEEASTRIGQIRCFIRVTNCSCVKLCDCAGSNYAILRPCVVDTPFSTCIEGTVLSSIYKIRSYEEQESAVDVSMLNAVCFYSKILQDTFKEYVIEPVNVVESE